MMWLRLAVREIRNSPRFSLFFVLNLCLGLSGFVALDSFQQSLRSTLSQQSKTLLGADLEISARRPFRPEELEALRKTLGPEANLVPMTSFFSMLETADATRLVRVKAIEPGYPFYGAITFREESGDLHAGPKAWIFPELAEQMGLSMGDLFRLGNAQFQVAGIVENDPSGGGFGLSLAPRVYIGREFLSDIGVLSLGTTAFHHWMVRLPDGTDLGQIIRQLDAILPDPAIRIESHEESGEDLSRLSQSVGDYLGLAALVALALAGLGSGFLFRSFLAGRLSDAGILRSLGASRRAAATIYFFQVFLLGILSALPTLVLATLLLPGISNLNEGFLPVPVALQVSTGSIALSLFVGVMVSLLSCGPTLRIIWECSPLQLLSQTPLYERPRRSWITWALWIPVLLFFWMAAVRQANSWIVASWFTAGAIACGLLFAFIGRCLLAFLGRMKTSSTSLRMATRHLSRNRLASLSVLVALALGCFLLNLIPQVERTLRTEMERPGDSRLPSFFLFDIQPDQLPALEEFLSKRNLTLQFVSPLIRARLESVNGAVFVKKIEDGRVLTREEERAARFRNRGFNLTVRAELSPTESLVSGSDFASAKVPEGQARISVERRFAKRLGLSIGDVLQFDVQGIPVTGTIVNLRRVRWTSFQPNFFVVFEPGFLEAAPSTFLASLAEVPSESIGALQNELVRELPNISMIDVRRVVSLTINLVEKMAWAIAAMGTLALVAGLAVLVSIVNTQMVERRYELALMRAVGARRAELQKILFWEALLLGSVAAGLGGLGAIGLSYILSRTLFESLWVLRLDALLGASLALVALCCLVFAATVQRVARQKPNLLLQDGR